MIEDTSFIVDVLRGDDAAIEMLEVVERSNRPERVASITVLELFEGLAQSVRPGEELTLIQEVLASKHVVPGDEAVMRKAGTISGELTGDGVPIDREDCVVAATALLRDEPVITRNVSHFERVDGVEVLAY